jgi:soluble lytic murein transglycosylase-like protein
MKHLGFARRFEGRDDSGGFMNNRSRLTALVGAEHLSSKYLASSEESIDRVRSFRDSAQRAIMGLGIAAIVALAVMFVRPELLDDLKALSPFWNADSEPMDQRELAFADMLELPQRSISADAVTDDAVTAPSSKEQQRVTHWLAKRYRIAGSASKMLVDAAYESAQAVKLDPLLILAVMAIESRFNPFAESSVGAQGLMQVMSKVHHDKFSDHGGMNAVLNPAANIQVGAQILKDLIRRSGSVESGLKLYVGAGNLETDGGYAGKVMAEHARLQAVAAGKRVPTFTPPQAPESVREASAEVAPSAKHQVEHEPA